MRRSDIQTKIVIQMIQPEAWSPRVLALVPKVLEPRRPEADVSGGLGGGSLPANVISKLPAAAGPLLSTCPCLKIFLSGLVVRLVHHALDKLPSAQFTMKVSRAILQAVQLSNEDVDNELERN